MKKQVSKEGTPHHTKYEPIFVKIELIKFSFKKNESNHLFSSCFLS